MTETRSFEPAHILIVDDLPYNIQIVASMLQQANYRLSFAQSGQIALSLVAQNNFDLILLDVQMPVMDGFQVCEILKSKPETRQVPIIFLTANSGAELTVHGFKLGAVDYITKPVEANELRARVETHLALKLGKDKILQQNQRLLALNQEKNRLLEIVSHDLRSPLTVLISGIEYLKRHYAQPEVALRRRLDNMEIATERMENMLQRYLNQESIQAGYQQIVTSSFLLAKLLTKILSHHQEHLRLKEITVHCSVPENIQLNSDQAALEQIFDNLISNAIKFSPRERQIWIRAEQHSPDKVWVEIQDEGPGFTEEELLILFKSPGKLSATPTLGEASLGLGLSIIKNLLEYVDGQIQCSSKSGFGACFRVVLACDLVEET